MKKSFREQFFEKFVVRVWRKQWRRRSTIATRLPWDLFSFRLCTSTRQSDIRYLRIVDRKSQITELPDKVSSSAYASNAPTPLPTSALTTPLKYHSFYCSAFCRFNNKHFITFCINSFFYDRHGIISFNESFHFRRVFTGSKDAHTALKITVSSRSVLNKTKPGSYEPLFLES